MTGQKKILTVNTSLNKGGAAYIARTLHTSLGRFSEFTNHFAYGRGPNGLGQREFKFALRPEIYLHVFLTRTTGWQGYGSYLSTKRLERFIIREGIDLIHVHNLHGYYLNLNFVRFLGKLGIPVVWTLHDGWPITGRCAYCFECDYWRTGCGNCSFPSLYPKAYFDSSALMWKKKKKFFTSGWNPVIVCPSEYLADRLKESYLSEFRIEVIPNGIDLRLFRPKDKIGLRKTLGIDVRKRIVLFAAADLRDECKGVNRFLEALTHVMADDWMVLTLGKKIALPPEVGNGIDLMQLGYISDRNCVSDIYNVADVFCVASTDENFPTTILESLACGTPIVGFKVGGIPEQVPQDCGILVESKDCVALGRALEKTLENSALREGFSSNCRRHALENYSVDRFTTRYIQLYRELLS